jgi:hypothetical protein
VRAAADTAFRGSERFQLLSYLGEGGMGTVYQALDRERNVRVALKTLRNVGGDEILRFKREFRSLAELHHRNLVSFGELFEHEGHWFFTMELVEGASFLAWVRPDDLSNDLGFQATVPFQSMETFSSGPPSDDSAPDVPGMGGHGSFDEARLRAALRELARGVEVLHGGGMIHRDIKPSNVLVARDGRVVLLDFGLVADLREPHRSDSSVVGTAHYMAPEQGANKPVGPEADWYSVGVVLYQALTGRLPFIGRVMEVLAQKQHAEPPSPRELVPEVPEDLDVLCRELLRIDPAARPRGREILARLALSEPVSSRRTDSTAPSAAPVAPFVGRARELEALFDAFAECARGRSVTVCLRGDSGVGKSALARSFVERLAEVEPSAVVLAGRCYERETVPYKALDGVIDALSNRLREGPADRAAAVIPRHASLLGQAFPVLQQVRAIAQAPLLAEDVLAPAERRARVFGAVRELFVRLCDRHPVVLVIDDLQWADADSLQMLGEILRPPDAPALLLVATMRASVDPAIEEALRAATSRGVREIVLTGLSHDDARRLVAELLGPDDVQLGAADIVAQTAGHPLFIDELARHVRDLGRRAPGPVLLEDALWARIERLGPSTRALLDVVSVAGHPLTQSAAARALGAEASDMQDVEKHIAVLRSGNLVRTRGARASDSVETFHDRVREAVLAHLSPAALADCHRRLAQALASEPTDPEVLCTHFLGAGDRAEAARYAEIAAGEAMRALAFQRAARLYRTTIELRSPEDPARPALLCSLGDALASAARGGESATVYLEAARAKAGAPAESLDLKRRAAEQLLISGRIDEGLAAIEEVLAAVGMKMPRTPRGALLSLLGRRAQLRMRGLSFRPRTEADIAPEELMRIDACWSVGTGLAVVDTIRGSHFQTRNLLLALDAGEPLRIARGLALEAGYNSTAGGPGEKRTAALLEAAGALAKEVGHPHALGLVTMATGIAGYLEGRWSVGRSASEAAEEMLRTRCVRVSWELDSALLFGLWSTSFLGDCLALGERVPARLREAEERGDLYAATYLRTGLLNVAWLLGGDPERARRECVDAMDRWSKQGSHMQHHFDVVAQGQIDLYLGRGADALARIRGTWKAIQRSLVMEIQHVRVLMHQFRGRAALCMAEEARGAERAPLLASAESDAARIAKEKMPWSDPLASLLRAAVASARGEREGAAERLREAARGFDAAGMQLYAAASRRRLGGMIGGDEGRAMASEAEAWMQRQRIASPERMTGMLAPGLV